MPTVIALGGNALLPKDAPHTFAAQQERIRETAAQIAPLLDGEVLLTHGNGPQVGDLLLEQAGRMARPLDVVVAETQAQIGYSLQQACNNEIGAERFSTVVTRVEVDKDDLAFDDPSKPVGPYYTADEAAETDFPTMKVDDSDHGYRRVVPSPAPRSIVDIDAIKAVLAAGKHVICCGGGGIPVVQDDGYAGVEAVIDKDAASALLAAETGSDTLLLLTTVDHAERDFGTDDAEPIRDVTADEMEQLIGDGHFGAGSMRPKAEACVNFIRRGGKQAIITTPGKATAALQGETGTRVTA